MNIKNKYSQITEIEINVLKSISSEKQSFWYRNKSDKILEILTVFYSS